MIKLTLLGDIMCEPLLLRAAKRGGDAYDFAGVFDGVKPLLAESDYVIGNLETPLAGREARYTRELFSFNTPDAFAAAARDAGIDFLSTANNHCLDRGPEGLKKTVRALDALGIAHGGTREDSRGPKAPFVADVKGCRVAIIPCTYGFNEVEGAPPLPDEGCVDLLHAPSHPVYSRATPKKPGGVKGLLKKAIKKEQVVALKKALGMTYNRPRSDDYLDEAAVKPYFEALRASIAAARERADIVLFYPHVGGQFNPEPGRFTRYTVDRALEFGVDAIVASHPHIVQRAEYRGAVPVFYSTGNFSMSPNSVYLLHEHLPEYGLAVHLYVQGNEITKTTFSILKIIEQKGKMLKVWPVDQLSEVSEAQVGRIYRTVTGRELKERPVRREYEL